MLHSYLYPATDEVTVLVWSSTVDKLSNTLLVCMMHSKIATGMQRTGMDELIQVGIDGIFCCPDDPCSLLGAIEHLFVFPAGRWKAMESRAPGKVGDFAPDNATPKLLSFYEYVRRDFSDCPGVS